MLCNEQGLALDCLKDRGIEAISLMYSFPPPVYVLVGMVGEVISSPVKNL